VSQGILAILDGGRGLYAGVRKSFEKRVLVQRCQGHKRENVVSYLPRNQQARWRKRLQQAYEKPTYAGAEKALLKLLAELHDLNPPAAASLREGMEETVDPTPVGVVSQAGTIVPDDELPGVDQQHGRGAMRENGRMEKLESEATLARCRLVGYRASSATGDGPQAPSRPSRGHQEGSEVDPSRPHEAGSIREPMGRGISTRKGIDSRMRLTKAKFPILVLPLALLVMTTSQETKARTWRVESDGSGEAPTIQAGIDSAASGDIILVGAGTYFEIIDFLGKDLELRSQFGREATTIDGSGGDTSVITLAARENAVIEGFTITGGVGTTSGYSRRGGGVYSPSASPRITDNAFIRNSAIGSVSGVGGAIYAGASPSTASPTIAGNIFLGNECLRLGGAIGLRQNAGTRIVGNIFIGNSSDHDGGAICLLGGDSNSLLVADNQFWNNTAGDHGGAVYLAGDETPVAVEWNLFVRNAAFGGAPYAANGTGGALHMITMSGRVSHNTLAYNEGDGDLPCSGGGIYLDLRSSSAIMDISYNIIAFSGDCGVACDNAAGATMENNILWENDGGDIGNQSRPCPAEWAEGNLFADPLFCGPTADNFTVSANSPALGREVIGVFSRPGCGDGVLVTAMSWGGIKTRFR